MSNNCPYCGSKSHRAKKVNNNKVQRKCQNDKCGRYFTTIDEGLRPEIKAKLPKILIFDIETAPLRAFVFQMSVWGGNVRDDQVITEWFMLTWSAKWLFDDKVYSAKLTGEEARVEDDSRITKSLWNLINEADIIVAHNGGRFDVPNINTRFLMNGLPPCAPYQQIDTKKIASKQFGFTHNSLNGLAKIFNLPQKLDTDFELWKRCLNGEKKALLEMETYNKQDVEILEEVYLRLRPWVKSHPNVALYVEADRPICTHCGSDDLTPVNKDYHTMTGRYATHRCGNCGTIVRERKTQYPKDKSKALLSSLAR